MSEEGHSSGRIRRRDGWRPPSERPKPKSDAPAPDARPGNGAATPPLTRPDGEEEIAGRRAAFDSPRKPTSSLRRVAGEVSGLGMASLPAGASEAGPVVMFRVETRDATGSRTGIIPVRLKGASAIGFAEDGDWVEVSGRSRKGVLDAHKARNKTTGASFESSPTVRRLVIAVFTLFFLAVIAFIVFLAIPIIQPQVPGPDAEPPTTPQNLRVESKNGCSVTLRWDPPENAVSVFRYRIYDGSTFKGLVDGKFTSYVVQMFPGDEHSFTVLASDARNNESHLSDAVLVNPC